VPFQNFPTADGWIVVACPKEKFWQLLCDAIGRPELAEEFPAFADRDRRRDELEPILEGVFRERTSEEWLALLAGAGVPSAPVNGVEKALAEARLVEYEHPSLGAVRQVASPLRLSGAEPPVRTAPARGEHTERVLVDLCGYEPARVHELAASGVFGRETKGGANAQTGSAT
jgi:crotonobetainyl-CoA:carnitine CoA-transferase CaiB-like acyl-CoA transferase